ncbi:nucleoside-diphosphate kinase [Streptomyces sp. NPDC093249]|uniref:nucleoside-diphosphate kinase n=1 Tax=unclassified Streptomyces TaxID=2593676 RepID=UPI0037F70A4D
MLAQESSLLEPDRFALLIVKPDGVAQHLTRLISLWTRDRGYKLRGFRELILNQEHQLILDADTQAGSRIDRQLSEVFYGLGPTHVLLLEREGSRSSGNGSAAAELAGRFTGDALPHRARPGTLRGDFRALNPVFNLVHATNSTDNLDRDAHALFERPLVELLGLNGARPDGIAQTPHLLRPFKLWSTVTNVLATWLGSEVVRPIDWPADSHGPSRPAVGRRPDGLRPRRPASRRRGWRSAVGSAGREHLLHAVRPPGSHGGHMAWLPRIHDAASLDAVRRHFVIPGPCWPRRSRYSNALSR